MLKISPDVTTLARRVFLTHNKLIRKPGHVGKRTRSCTLEKCPLMDKNTLAASVRKIISCEPKLASVQGLYH